MKTKVGSPELGVADERCWLGTDAHGALIGSVINHATYE